MQGRAAPVIFLTARDALPDRLAGFAAGGDDYLTKPSRVRGARRRPRRAPEAGGRPTSRSRSVGYGSTRAPIAGLRAAGPGAHANGVPILARLAANPGRRCAADSSSQAAWPHGAIVHDNTLNVCIARLRRKLAPLPGSPAIGTARGGLLAAMRRPRCASVSARVFCSPRWAQSRSPSSSASPHSTSCSASGSRRARRRSHEAQAAAEAFLARGRERELRPPPTALTKGRRSGARSGCSQGRR